MQNQIQTLIKGSKHPQPIREAFELAKSLYGDKKRSSGESYLDHVTDVALILQNLGIDQTTIIAGILHDTANTAVTENKKGVITDIAAKFGTETATLVENSSSLNKIYYSFIVAKDKETLFNEQKAEHLRNMFFAMAQDLRVILIELAARIDGLNKLSLLTEDAQKLYATETLQIFVPIANRLGLGEVKRTLEDAAFKILQRADFDWLEQQLKEKYQTRQKYLKTFAPKIKKILKEEKISIEAMDSRAKSSWSTWQKLQSRAMDIEKIYDLVALRIIVKDVAACYKTLGIIHKHFIPFSGKIQDYIAKPKANGYQSIHTTVYLEEDKFSEIQIRTEKMHQEAQFGICAHWVYKEKKDHKSSDTLFWSKEIPELLKTFNINFFQDRIFTFTPKGDVIELPRDSTPVDFAYAVHSDIGNHCESAKIDGKIIQLSQVLKNGDVVEIITNKKRMPSYDWLKFVKTNFAKSHIKKLITSIPISIFSVPNFVKKKIGEISQRAQKRREEKVKVKKQGPSQIYLAGQAGIMVTMAKCCLPKSGDETKAYLTRHRAAVLHKTSCVNLQKLSQKSPEKIVAATWEKSWRMLNLC